MRKAKIGIFVVLFFLIACQIKPYQEGERLYTAYCSNCHMEDGWGLKGLIPPLANADYLSNYKSQIPCIIRYGIKGEIIVNGKTYNTEMAGIQGLTDVQINNIINYINHAWGNQVEQSNIKDVRRYLDACN